MNPAEFIQKWKTLQLTEKAGAHPWFFDLCAMLDVPTPGQNGADYTFEKSVKKLSGGSGWADFWNKGCFAWEFKGRGENLEKAYQQLKNYAEALQNSPLLVVSDFDTIIDRTNFTYTKTETYHISLEDFGDPDNRKILQALWHDPESLRPGPPVRRRSPGSPPESSARLPSSCASAALIPTALSVMRTGGRKVKGRRIWRRGLSWSDYWR
jgi:hypothetical protein